MVEIDNIKIKKKHLNITGELHDYVNTNMPIQRAYAKFRTSRIKADRLD